MSAQIRAQAMKDAGFGHAPYAETYTGNTQPYGAATIPPRTGRTVYVQPGDFQPELSG